MNYFDIAVGLIKEAEGFRAEEYHCPAGKLTQGYGRNLEVHPLSLLEHAELENGLVDEATAIKWLKKELMALELRLVEVSSFKFCNDIRKAVLLDMAFNLGFDGLMKFKKMHKALEKWDWVDAAKEMKDSNWYVQVGNRSKRNIFIMRDGLMYTYADIDRLSDKK